MSGRSRILAVTGILTDATSFVKICFTFSGWVRRAAPMPPFNRVVRILRSIFWAGGEPISLHLEEFFNVNQALADTLLTNKEA